MSVNSLELQLATAIVRFNTLQRRVDTESTGTPLLSRALGELEKALEEVRVAQEQLVENGTRLEELQVELTQQYEKYWQLFDEMPQAYLVTRPDTVITEANRAAAELLNVSQRFLVGKALSVFVCEDRTKFLQNGTYASETSGTMELKLRLRPRERATIAVEATVKGSPASLRWVLRPGAV